MFKRFVALVTFGVFLLITAGCNLIGIVLAAASAFGLAYYSADRFGYLC